MTPCATAIAHTTYTDLDRIVGADGAPEALVREFRKRHHDRYFMFAVAMAFYYDGLLPTKPSACDDLIAQDFQGSLLTNVTSSWGRSRRLFEPAIGRRLMRPHGRVAAALTFIPLVSKFWPP